jgi:tRNA 2-thiocytidine biosynthesis protein TtcA
LTELRKAIMPGGMNETLQTPDVEDTGADPSPEREAAPALAETMEAGPSLYAEAPSSVSFNKLRKRLIRNVRQAIEDFAMVAPAAAASGKRPRWLVALSGGKDSYGLLALLMDLQWRGMLPVDLIACNLDQGQPNFPSTSCPIISRPWHSAPDRVPDTYSVVTEDSGRGHLLRTVLAAQARHLYRIAREEGCEALVLGHHRDDILETFFLNLFHGGRLEAMPPKLLNDDGDVMVLRPMAYCAEEDLARFAEAMKFPIIPCDLCGSQDGLQRNAMKADAPTSSGGCPAARIR